MVALKNPSPVRPDAQCTVRNASVQSSDSVEWALFRAREAFEAGWQLTPEEALALINPSARLGSSRIAATRMSLVELEDEVDEIPLSFEDR